MGYAQSGKTTLLKFLALTFARDPKGKTGLVETRREGTWIHYKLAIPGSLFEYSLQEFLRKGLVDNPKMKHDLSRLLKASCS